MGGRGSEVRRRGHMSRIRPMEGRERPTERGSVRGKGERKVGLNGEGNGQCQR